jgi:hypothetical protein
MGWAKARISLSILVDFKRGIQQYDELWSSSGLSPVAALAGGDGLAFLLAKSYQSLYSTEPN